MAASTSLSGLASLLTPESLRRLAGAQTVGAGAEYSADGLVTGRVQDGDTLAGQVQGKQSYRVELQAAGDRLKHDCSCPFAAEALAWAERGLNDFPDAQDGRLAEFLVER